MKKSEKTKPVQMKLSEKEEWTREVPVMNGVAVSYARQGQVDECFTDETEKEDSTLELLEEVISLGNLERACRRVMRNDGSAGIDGMVAKELGSWLSKNWQSLQEVLRQGTYIVSGVREVEIKKPKGGYRKLGIPTVIDRMIQQAIHQVINRIYDKTFSPTSYGFREGRGTKNALRQVSNYLKLGKTNVVDIDMAKFFDEVNHSRLLTRLSYRIKDKGLLRLIHQYLKAGILNDPTDKRDTARKSAIAFIIEYSAR